MSIHDNLLNGFIKWITPGLQNDHYTKPNNSHFTAETQKCGTARIEDTDKVKGFAVGGDDYIVKPFSLIELEARVCAHLRREAQRSFEAQVKFTGELIIDYSERCLFFADKRLSLTKKEFDIEELLSQNIGQVFDKERIYEHIWGYDSEGDSSVVAEHIRRIRTKIAIYTDKSYIETVWGCGYKWIK